ncbi:MAG: type IV pilin N-terminal domain-containing protein [Methanoregula sp.]
MAFTKKNEEAVSPVIGVILMVAITVILAAVIAAFVFGMAGNIQSTKTVGVTLTSNQTNFGVATITGGADLKTLNQVNASIDGATEVILIPSPVSVGKYGTTTTAVNGKRVILTGYFTDGTVQMLIDKQF